MDTWSAKDRWIGLWSARVLVLVAVVYVLVGAVWLFTRLDSFQEVGFQPDQPYLSILETLLVITGLLEVTLFAAIFAYAPRDRKTFGLASLCFTVILAALTCTVHFVRLTVGRQAVADGPDPTPFDPWPTVLFSIDLLAWDVFQGLALLLAAPIFRGDRLHDLVRRSMTLSGALCLTGVVGPSTGLMQLQVLAIAGYAFGFPFVGSLLVILFGRSAVAHEDPRG
jgi:uncharacterized membrane protein